VIISRIGVVAIVTRCLAAAHAPLSFRASPPARLRRRLLRAHSFLPSRLRSRLLRALHHRLRARRTHCAAAIAATATLHALPPLAAAAPVYSLSLPPSHRLHLFLLAHTCTAACALPRLRLSRLRARRLRAHCLRAAACVAWRHRGRESNRQSAWKWRGRNQCYGGR